MLLCPPGVYRAEGDTEILTDVMRRGGYALGRDVLDVGTGSGALAIAAARSGASSVTAVDLSLRSVAATWLNAGLHRAAVTIRRGDLFAPVSGRRFEAIVSNPPYLPSEEEGLPARGARRAWEGGRDGRLLLDRVVEDAPAHLCPGGVLLLVQSSVCGIEATLEGLSQAGLEPSVAERRRGPLGPLLASRAHELEARGLLRPGEREEEVVAIRAEAPTRSRTG